MTRRVQAVNAARQEFNICGTDTYFPSRRVEDFVQGVEWADMNPINYDGKAMLHVLNKGHEQGWKDAIDKACEWLKCNFNMPDDFESHFRKAMEENK